MEINIDNFLNTNPEINLGSKYIFVAGSPRSGTSLLQKILNNHSEIYGGPEFMHLIKITNLYKQMHEGIRNKRQATYYDESTLMNNVRHFVHDIFMNKINNEKVKFLSEKTPDNLLIFNDLSELFPEAKFIIIVRNPFAVLNSYRKVAKRGKKENILTPIGNNLIQDINKIINYMKIAGDFVTSHSKNSLLVYYEDLIMEPEKETKKIVEFIGIKYENEMINTEKRNENSNLIELKQAKPWYTSEMYDSKINTKKMNEWENELTKHEKLLLSHFLNKNNLGILEYYNFKGANNSQTMLHYFYEIIKVWMKRKFKF